MKLTRLRRNLRMLAQRLNSSSVVKSSVIFHDQELSPRRSQMRRGNSLLSIPAHLPEMVLPQPGKQARFNKWNRIKG